MAVRSEPTAAQPRHETRIGATSKPRLGFLRPVAIERAFITLLYLALAALVLLSVLGTFYGQQGKDAPITTPLQVIQDIKATPVPFALAIGVQVVLTLTQYGARQFARRDRRWWILYLVALGISVYYNWQAYWAPLNTLVAWYLAALLIIAGDVLPEFIAVRHD